MKAKLHPVVELEGTPEEIAQVLRMVGQPIPAVAPMVPHIPPVPTNPYAPPLTPIVHPWQPWSTLRRDDGSMQIWN